MVTRLVLTQKTEGSIPSSSTKFCNGCNQEKEIEKFSWKNKQKQIRHSACKECHKILHDEWYKQNKEKVTKRTAINNLGYRNKTRQYLSNYLFKNPCIDCGEKDIRVLDFDHIDDKRYNISTMVSKLRK